jgi:hypothetical protein
MTIQPGIYRHFKGKNYEVTGIAHHSETLEEMVIYRALYTSPEFGENALWVRPLSMWEEEVEFEGKKVKRFELIDLKK